MNRSLCFFLTMLLVLGAALAPPPAQAATFTVTRTDDPPPDGCQPGDCSLREAIIAANNAAGPDTITLSSGHYNLTIVGTGEDAAATGDLDITDDLTVVGADAKDPASTTIGAAPDDRVFDIVGPIGVTISNLTIGGGYPRLFGSDGGGLFNRGGRVTLSDVIVSDNQVLSLGGGIANDEGELILTNVAIKDNFTWSNGGGIFNKGGKLILTNVDISGNEAYYALGGGIANNEGEWTLTNVAINKNIAGEFGGGIYNVYGRLTLTDCVISDNQAKAFSGEGIETVSGILNLTDVEISGNRASGGGGIANSNAYNRETVLTLRNVTIRDNQADYGGGIVNGYDSKLVIDNSTLSGNKAMDDGGGLFNSSVVTLSSVTIANNSADSDSDGNGDGGGLYNLSDSGAVTLKRILLAGNSDPGGEAPDCGGGELISQGYNLIQTTTGCALGGDASGNLTGVDPLLGPLADNGGPTLTHLPAAGSPAIDAGDPANCPATDQRGFPRPVDGDGKGAAVCDIGAVEFGASSASGQQFVYLPLVLK